MRSVSNYKKKRIHHCSTINTHPGECLQDVPLCHPQKQQLDQSGPSCGPLSHPYVGCFLHFWRGNFWIALPANYWITKQVSVPRLTSKFGSRTIQSLLGQIHCTVYHGQISTCEVRREENKLCAAARAHLYSSGTAPIHGSVYLNQVSEEAILTKQKSVNRQLHMFIRHLGFGRQICHAKSHITCPLPLFQNHCWPWDKARKENVLSLGGSHD